MKITEAHEVPHNSLKYAALLKFTFFFCMHTSRSVGKKVHSKVVYRMAHVTERILIVWFPLWLICMILFLYLSSISLCALSSNLSYRIPISSWLKILLAY